MLEIEHFSQCHLSKPVLVTFIYPAVTTFLDFLTQNINAQTTDDFVLLVFNDGVTNPSAFFKDLKVPCLVCEVAGFNPMEIRFEGLEILKKTSFSKFIFQDSDDGLSPNRIQVVSELLDKYAFVVNDLDLMDGHGEVFKEKIWEARFEQEKTFTAQYLSSSNFAGLGNTSITANLLSYLPPRPDYEIIAVDWYLFYACLARSAAKGYRTSNCTTRYRQHTNNTIGLQQAQKDKIDEAIRLHYFTLNQVGVEVEKEYKGIINQRLDAFWWETESKL